MGKSGNWSTSLMWHFRVFRFLGLWYVGLIQRAYPRNEGSKLQYQANHHGDLVRYIMICFDLELTLWYWLGFVQKMNINWVQPGGRRCTALFRRGKGNELLDCWVWLLVVLCRPVWRCDVVENRTKWLRFVMVPKFIQFPFMGCCCIFLGCDPHQNYKWGVFNFLKYTITPKWHLTLRITTVQSQVLFQPPSHGRW